MNIKSFLKILRLNRKKIQIIDDNKISIFKNINEIPTELYNRSILCVLYCRYIQINIDFLNQKTEEDITPVHLNNVLPILNKTYKIEYSSDLDKDNEIEYISINTDANVWYIKFMPNSTLKVSAF